MAARGLTRPSELARRMKLSRQTVHNWTTGRGENLTPEMLYRLADALEVNPRWLALGPPNVPAAPVYLSPEDQEVLEIRNMLETDTREQWLTHGRTIARLTSRPSAANPFAKRNK